MKKQKIFIIANPTSGSFSNFKLNTAVTKLQENAFICNIELTKYPHHAQKIAQNAEKVDIVCAMGGDGTISEVLSGLTKNPHKPTFALLPTGTANVLAIELGIKNFANAIKAIIKNKASDIFLGQAKNAKNETRIFTIGSIGFDAQIVKNVNLTLKRYLGKFAYVIAGIKYFFTSLPKFIISVSSKKISASWVIFLMGKYYAGSFKLDAKNSLKEPYISIIVFQKNGFFANFWNIFTLFFKLHKRLKNVQTFTAKNFKIESSKNVAAQIDGDTLPTNFNQFSVYPTPIKIIQT
jgi:YegS/Rv2252/BmrU family lipid kinase